MAKRRLSDKQQQTIQQQQANQSETALSGLVVAHFGDSIILESVDKTFFKCNLRQNLPPIVVGDKVAWQIDDAEKALGTILALEPRHSEMWRKNQRGDVKIVAANVDLIVVVIAPEPKRSEQILDRYLAVAELQQIPALILFNKLDLLTPDELAIKQTFYANYQKIGYPVLFISPIKQINIELFIAALAGKMSVVVGLSGVGKSSLVKSLLPEADIKIGDLSNNRLQLGQHTTTTARLYNLIGGGTVIDSPGVREFAMQGLSQRDLEQGFKEFAPYLGTCKFRDCRHINDPGCAIVKAVAEGDIEQARWDAYQRILNGVL